MEHQKESIGKRLLKCKYCTALSNALMKRYLNKHLSREHTHKCDRCNSMFRDESQKICNLNEVHEYSNTTSEKTQ